MLAHAGSLQRTVGTLHRITKGRASRQRGREHLLQVEKSVYPQGAVKASGNIGKGGAQRIVDYLRLAARQRFGAIADPGRNTQCDAINAAPRIQ